MALMLPDVCHDDRFKGLWEFDSHGMPTPKEGAPKELVEALIEFRDNVEKNSGLQADGTFRYL